MRLPDWIIHWLQGRVMRVIDARRPDFTIRNVTGETAGEDYLRRWWIIPRNPLFNIYLHEILVSDDDRALHDHPWVNISIILAGGYWEHVIAAGGVHHRYYRRTGSVTVRRARAAHRLEVSPGHHAFTLFITGPRLRAWGFHCPDAGWRHWRDFTGEDKGRIGRGCGE